jgi:hypothetical protein
MLRSPEPTAEQVIQATEAAYLLRGAADLADVARFMALDVSVQHQRQQVEHAMLASAMLGLANLKGRSRKRYHFSPLVPLLVRARNEDKRVLFGVHLNQYEPFVVFIDRLRAGNPPQQAALQVCAVYAFADDPVVAWRAFESWGTFAGSLVRGQDGQYAPSDTYGNLDSLRQSLNVLFDQERDARQYVLEQLGQEASEFIEGRVRDSLVDAIVMLANENQAENIILRIGNTYEDFLRLVGYRRVNLRNASGIIQIGNQLRNRGLIAQKHLGAIQLIGHVRNATDHGGDPDEGNRPWRVTSSTVRLMLLTVLSSIRSIVLYRARAVLQL